MKFTASLVIVVTAALAGCGGGSSEKPMKDTVPLTARQMREKAERLLTSYESKAERLADEAELASRAGHLTRAEVLINSAMKTQEMYGFLNGVIKEPSVGAAICVSKESKEKALRSAQLARYWRVLCLGQ